MPDIPPVLNVWTAASRGVTTVAEAVVDVSTGTRAQPGRTFAPPWELTRRRTRGTCNEEEFYAAYMNVLRRRYQQRPGDFVRVVEQRQVVLVAETPAEDGAWDHRHVLVRALKQTAEALGYGVNYHGELHPASRLPGEARPMRLAIFGGEQSQGWMAEYAASYVRRAAFRGWEVLVGDRPDGVDLAVRQECQALDAKVIVAGNRVTPTIPHQPYAVLGDSPTERDRLLAELADVGVFLSVGDPAGLRELAARMREQGKPVHVIQREGRCQKGRRVPA